MESVQVAVHGGIGINLVLARPSVLYHAVTSAGDGLVFILLPVRWIGRLVYIDMDLGAKCTDLSQCMCTAGR